MRKVVANTTPLIAFARQNRLEILERLYGELVIPEAVLYELKSEPVRSRVLASPWIHVMRVGGGL